MLDEKIKTVAIYKKHRSLFKMFKDKNTAMIDKSGNVTTNYETCEEVIVTNF